MNKYRMFDLVLIVILVIVSLIVVGQSNAQGPKTVSFQTQPDGKCAVVMYTDFINGWASKHGVEFNNVDCESIRYLSNGNMTLVWFVAPTGDYITLYQFVGQDHSFSILFDSQGRIVDF